MLSVAKVDLIAALCGGPVPWVCVGLVEMVNGELARFRCPNLQLICQVDRYNPLLLQRVIL